MVAPARRSTREKRVRYSLDSFEGYGDSSNDEQLPDVDSLLGPDSDASQDEEYSGSSEEDGSVDNDDNGTASGSEAGSGIEDSSDGESSFSDSDESGRPSRTQASTSARYNQGRTQEKINEENFQTLSKQDRYWNVFGKTLEELGGGIRSRDRWCGNMIFPRRRMDRNGGGGFRTSYCRSDEHTAVEETEDWQWYYGGGKASIDKNQKLEVLLEEAGRRYLCLAPDAELKVFMGPRNRPKLQTFQPLTWVRLHDIWKEAEQGNPVPAKASPRSRKSRSGWMVNAACAIHDLSWLPKDTGTTQYLVLATAPSPPEPDPSDSGSDSDGEWETGLVRAPAFASSPPLPASIQFWALPSSTEAGKEGHMDSASRPRLALVLCTDWGPVKQLKWCPVPRRRRRAHEGEEFILLAGVWADGRLRVLRFPYAELVDGPTRYVRFAQAAFEAYLPCTVGTTLDWLSASHIAVGCGNGFVAIWDISQHLCPTPAREPSSTDPDPDPDPDPADADDLPRAPWQALTAPADFLSGTAFPASSSTSSCPATNARPIFVHALHSTYILTLTCCYPSHPTLLLTTAMDGNVRMTDMRAPTTETVFSMRSRSANTTLAWCDTMQSALAADETNIIRLIPARRFYSSISVGRAVASAAVIATSPIHTTVLVGAADGTAIAVNPWRRYVNARRSTPQINWFAHEWRRDGGGGADGGVARLTEGFRVEAHHIKTALPDAAGAGAESEAQTAASSREAQIAAYTHEPNSAVSHLVWNPNVLCGGWAVAALATGLIRVEDLAV
ncbi:MAG: hypothetical protein M1826_004812 [Phylliscum demangeonii]|nr:MAG: hypothetical protein M1826_004812 [Phylliscum demangeonii]